MRWIFWYLWFYETISKLYYEITNEQKKLSDLSQAVIHKQRKQLTKIAANDYFRDENDSELIELLAQVQNNNKKLLQITAFSPQ